MAWGFAGSALNAAGNITSSAIQNSRSQSSTTYDLESSFKEKALESWFWKNDTEWYNDNIVGSAYQRARKSLENAGYNPLMALMNGGLYDQAPVMTGSATKSSANEVSMSRSMGKLADSENALNWAQTDYTSALSASEGIKQIGYTTDNLIKKAEQVIQDNNAKWIDKRNANEIKNIASQTQKNIAEIGLIGTQKTLNSAKAAEAKAKAYENRANAKYTLNKPIQTQKHGGGAKVHLGPASAGWDVYDEW